jgi:hypothetical protein
MLKTDAGQKGRRKDERTITAQDNDLVIKPQLGGGTVEVQVANYFAAGLP